MRSSIMVAVLVSSVLAGPAYAQSRLNKPTGEIRAFPLDSEVLPGLADEPATVYQEDVQVQDAAWIRVFFGPEIELGEGSFIRITSLLDNEDRVRSVQRARREGQAKAHQRVGLEAATLASQTGDLPSQVGEQCDSGRLPRSCSVPRN